MTTTTRKMQAIKDLTAKHFIAWIKKQVRLNGRHAVIGFIGDHRDNPLENWLQELTGERYIPVMIEGFEVAGVEYALSNTFQWLSMAFEGDLDADDVLEENGWREITAWETLQMVEQLVSPEDYLVAQPVAEPVEGVAASTDPVVEQEVVPVVKQTRKASAKIVTVIARYFFKKNGHVVYACRGSHGETYCTTVINGKATGCTCPAHKPCKHMTHCQNLEQSRTAKVEQAAAAGDRTFVDAVLDKAYAMRGQEIEAAGTLNRNRKPVASVGQTSIESNLSRMGWMR